MEMTKQDVIKALQTSESLFVAYSQATRLPYVTCDEDSFNDQAWIFSTEEEIKAFGKERLEDKILLMGMKYEKKDLARLYGVLYAVGVNSVVYNAGETKMEVELSDVAKQADLSGIEEAKRPLFNPSLQLSGMYLMQELRRPVKREEHKNMRETEEEFLANVLKASFLVAMSVDPEDPKKISVPYLKNKDGKVLQPFFSDVVEFEKFAKGKQLRAAKVPFNKLPGLMMKEAEGFALNPFGFNLIFDRNMINRLLGGNVKFPGEQLNTETQQSGPQEIKIQNVDEDAENMPS